MTSSWRRLRFRLAGRGLDLIYGSRYVQDVGIRQMDPRRGQRVISFLDEVGYLKRRTLHRPTAAGMHRLQLAHSDTYLESLQQRGATSAIVGHRLDDEAQDEFLEAQRVMVGGTLLAARLAVRSGRPAVNLGGGLHHATADRGQGFCAFNDVAVAIRSLRQDGFEGRVLVVDLDLHDGEGTRAIFAEDSTVHTFSIHNRTLGGGADAAVESTAIELGDGVRDETYLTLLREKLPEVASRFRPALIVFLAGVDVARDDLLGDWEMTEAGILARDRLVAELSQQHRAPLVVCLAGGYGPSAWRYGVRTCLTLVAPWETISPPSTLDLSLRPYRAVARMLRDTDLTAEPGDENAFELHEDDLLPTAQRRSRLLGFYSRHGLELAMERYGVLPKLRARGFHHLRLDWDLAARDGELIRAFAQGHREPLMEIRLRKDRLSLPPFEILFIDWLMLQDPSRAFSTDRPALPGQRHPGLGILKDIVSILVLACERLGLAGLGFKPAGYHVAARSLRRFVFAEPEVEARFRALRRALSRLPLEEAERRLAAGEVVDRRSGQPIVWEPALMIVPVDEALRDHVSSERFEADVAAHRHEIVIASTESPGSPPSPDGASTG